MAMRKSARLLHTNPLWSGANHQKEASEISRPQRRQKFAKQGGDKEVGVTPSTGPTLEASPEARRRPQCPKPAGPETRLGLARMESRGERAWLFSE